MARRGFFAELQHQSRVAERERVTEGGAWVRTVSGGVVSGGGGGGVPQQTAL